MFTFLLWCLLFVLCWPLALLALVLYPLVAVYVLMLENQNLESFQYLLPLCTFVSFVVLAFALH